MSHAKKTYSILGDSISTFQGYTPPGGVYYAPSSGAVTGVNSVEDTWWMRVIRAMDGALLANNSWSGSTVAADGNLGACSPSRIRKLAPKGVPPDHILVFSGLNDVARYVPLETFWSDYTLMLRRIRDAYPDAAVTCGTLLTGYIHRPLFPELSYFGQRLESYNRAIRASVSEAGCRLADLAALGESYEAMDGLHPSGTGMSQLAELWLRSLDPLP